MDQTILFVIIGVASLSGGLLIGKLVFARNTKKQVEEAEAQAANILKETALRAETIRKEKQLEAKEHFVQLKSDYDRDLLEKNKKIGEAENRIKELKYDFGFDSFNLKDFYATEAALTFVMIAYNLMAIFKLFVLQENTQKTLSTLRYRVFAVGAYFEKVGDDFILGDLRDEEFCKSVITDDIDELYQLAADMGGAGYIFTGNNDANVMHGSAMINLNVAHECVKKKVKKVDEWGRNPPLITVRKKSEVSDD